MFSYYSSLFPLTLIHFSFNFDTGFGDGCRLDVNRDIPTKSQPLLLRKCIDGDLELIIPEYREGRGVIDMAAGGELILACPGEHNSLAKSGGNVTAAPATCMRETKLKFRETGKSFESADAACKSPVLPEVRHVGTKCAAFQGKIYEIGFHVSRWFKLYEVCFNEYKLQTLYANHTLIGASVKAREKMIERPKFVEGNLETLYDDILPKELYKKSNQAKIFKSILGETGLDYVDDSGKFLAKGHIVPDADMLFSPWKTATYLFVNAAPQWQCCNSGNWKTVEGAVREVASRLEQNLQIYTGTYGILQLKSDSGVKRAVYLDVRHNRLPVPAFFWKIVYEPRTRKAVAFVTSNNPYVGTWREIGKLCRDICKKYDWPLSSKDVLKGYTYCCDPVVLLKKIKTGPPLRVNGILQMPLENKKKMKKKKKKKQKKKKKITPVKKLEIKF